MKRSSSIVLLLVVPLAGMAQSTVFNDTFGNGSTVNGTSTPGGTPAASSTSYDFASSKTGSESISANSLNIKLSSATSSGFVEAQAVFTATPVTLATVGDYVDLTYTFTDTANLLAGGTSSGIFTGLYNSGGTTPVAGGLNSAGLSTNSPSSFATGNAAGWQGYVSSITASGGSSKIYTRPQQTSGTTSANQDLIGNGFGGGTYVAVPGTQIGSTLSSTVVLTGGSQYTVDYRVALSAAGTLTISDSLYSGVGTAGTELSTQTGAASGATDLTQSIDSLAIGERNSGTSLNPNMDINGITVTDLIQPAPEPSTMALLGLGSLGFAWYRQRRHQA